MVVAFLRGIVEEMMLDNQADVFEDVKSLAECVTDV